MREAHASDAEDDLESSLGSQKFVWHRRCSTTFFRKYVDTLSAFIRVPKP